MPKFPTFPTLYDDALQINITKLKEWNFLKPQQSVSGLLTWNIKGRNTQSISIHANTLGEQPFIELDYKYGDEPRKYKIQLVSIPSNLGKGLIWYFICPETHLRCRKLYSIGGYFLHREAFQDCMYDSQKRSKYERWLDKNYGAYFKQERLFEQLNKKYFKKYYAGKPTKKYLRLMEQIEKAEKIPYTEIERLMVLGR